PVDQGPLWKDILGTLGGVGSVVTDSVAGGIKDVKDLVSGNRSLMDQIVGKSFGIGDDKTLGQRVIDAQIAQWSNSPGFQWNDIPVLGTANLANQVAKHGSDILAETGVNNQGAQRWGGLA